MPSHTGKYLCFGKSINEADAIAKFKQRFGVTPELTFRAYGILWVGPVPNDPDEQHKPQPTADSNQIKMDL